MKEDSSNVDRIPTAGYSKLLLQADPESAPPASCEKLKPRRADNWKALFAYLFPRTPIRIESADTVKSRAVRDNSPAASTFDGWGVACDLPSMLPIAHQEVALLRAFLGAEIDAILFGKGSGRGNR